MTTTASRSAARQKRHDRIRLRLEGDSARPRLAVFRSLSHIYAQVIDDDAGRTLASVSWTEADLRELKPMDQARRAGALLAERAKAAGIDTVVFDRGGYQYHGRVKALADAAREAGLEF